MKTSRLLSGLSLSPGSFRLLLAYLVFVHHLSRLSIGLAAVLLFFTLSGYWITKMWDFKYSRTKSSYLTFLISRFWRLFPMFFIAVCLTLCIPHNLDGLMFRGSWLHAILFIYFNVFIFGYVFNANPLVVPAWSLDIEMQFYILAPMILTIIKRARMALAAIALLGLISSLLLGARALPSYLIFFSIGVWSAISPPFPRHFALYGAITTALLTIGLILSPFRGMVLVGAHSNPWHVFNQAVNVVLAIFLIPLAMFTVRQPSGSFDRMLGDVSYPVYLFHWPAIILLRSMAVGTYLNRILYDLVAIGLVSLLSWIAWAAVDHPLNRIRAKWVNNRLL